MKVQRPLWQLENCEYTKKHFKRTYLQNKNNKYYCELAVKMVMSELHWHTASPEDNNNSLKHDLLKSHNNNTAAVHMMQNRCKFW